MTSVQLVVQDRMGNVIYLFLYNQLRQKAPLAEVQSKFPIGTEFGIKQPYKKVSFYGFIIMRNDNPQNIVFQASGARDYVDPAELKKRGNDLFKNGQNYEAIEMYKLALKEQRSQPF